MVERLGGMFRNFSRRAVLAAFVGLLLAGLCPTVGLAAGAEPAGLVLTWRKDPTTTMVIDWHRAKAAMGEPSVLRVRPAGDEAWREHAAQRRPFPHGEGVVDRVELEGLRPDTAYEFAGSEGGRVYSFRTMPAELERPLTFAAGGDVMHRRSWMEAMNRVVMRREPAFVVWGGDHAYADGKPENAGRWRDFLAAMGRTLVTAEGRVVPVVAGIGNHEIRGGYHNGRIGGPQDRERLAPFFYDFFAFPGQPGYGALDFGGYLSLIVADSGHSNPIEGVQTRWMERVLGSRREFTHVIPVYHVPAWPSVRKFDNRESVLVRQHWVPLFEKHGVMLALEHHDHAFKRSVPIHREKRDEERGIVYLGDGSWGVEPREVHKPEETWYLEKARSVRHAWVITLDRKGKKAEAVAEDGSILDAFELPLRPGRR